MPMRMVYSITQHLAKAGDPYGRWQDLALVHHPDYTVEVDTPLVNQRGNEVEILYYKASLELSQNAGHSVHLQGILELATKVSVAAISKWFSGEDSNSNGCHVELARDPAALDEYAEKTEDDSWLEGPWKMGWFKPYGEGQGKRNDLTSWQEVCQEQGWYAANKAFPSVLMRYPGGCREFDSQFGKRAPILGVPSELREWQKEVAELVSGEADDRTIIWVHDSKGGQGKTKLTKWLQHHHRAIALDVAKKDDLALILKNDLLRYPDCRHMIFDIPRSKVECMAGLYALAEKLKDGEFTSGKYGSASVRLTAYPHVIFFSNFKPEDGKWSADRIKLIDLDTWVAPPPPPPAFPEWAA